MQPPSKLSEIDDGSDTVLWDQLLEGFTPNYISELNFDNNFATLNAYEPTSDRMSELPPDIDEVSDKFVREYREAARVGKVLVPQEHFLSMINKEKEEEEEDQIQQAFGKYYHRDIIATYELLISSLEYVALVSKPFFVPTAIVNLANDPDLSPEEAEVLASLAKEESAVFNDIQTAEEAAMKLLEEELKRIEIDVSDAPATFLSFEEDARKMKQDIADAANQDEINLREDNEQTKQWLVDELAQQKERINRRAQILKEAKREHSATKIQRVMRGWTCRKASGLKEHKEKMRMKAMLEREEKLMSLEDSLSKDLQVLQKQLDYDWTNMRIEDIWSDCVRSDWKAFIATTATTDTAAAKDESAALSDSSQTRPSTSKTPSNSTNDALITKGDAASETFFEVSCLVTFGDDRNCDNITLVDSLIAQNLPGNAEAEKATTATTTANKCDMDIPSCIDVDQTTTTTLSQPDLSCSEVKILLDDDLDLQPVVTVTEDTTDYGLFEDSDSFGDFPSFSFTQPSIVRIPSPEPSAAQEWDKATIAVLPSPRDKIDFDRIYKDFHIPNPSGFKDEVSVIQRSWRCKPGRGAKSRLAPRIANSRERRDGPAMPGQHCQHVMQAYSSWQKIQPQDKDKESIDAYAGFAALMKAASSLQAIEEISPSQQRVAEAKQLDLSVECITNLHFLSNHSSIERLVLNVNKISSLDGLESTRNTLKHLSLVDNQLTDLKGLDAVPLLEYLNVDSNRLSAASLPKLPELRLLSANSNYLVEAPEISGDRLVRVDLYNNKICEITRDRLCGAPSMTYLNLGHNCLSHIDGEAFSACVNLQTLILSQNSLAMPPFPLRLPCLTSLWLNANRFSDMFVWSSGNSAVVEQAGEGNFLPALRKLYLQDNRIVSLHAESFRDSPLLSEIDLSFNSIAEIDSVSALEQCRSIEILRLNDNPIGEAMRRRRSSNEGQALIRWALSCFHKLKDFCGNSIEELRAGELSVESRPAELDPLAARFVHVLHHLKVGLDFASGRMRKTLAKSKAAAGSGVGAGVGAGGKGANDDAWWVPDQFQSICSKFQRTVLSQVNIHKLDVKSLLLPLTPDLALFLPISAESLKGSKRPLTGSRSKDNSLPMRKPSIKINTQGLVRFQAAFRGYLMRRRVRAYMRNIAYEDDELDEILGGNWDDEISPELFDTNILTDSYHGTGSSVAREGDKVLQKGVLASSLSAAAIEVEETSSNIMVYGDHVRKRSRENGKYPDSSENISAIASSSIPPSPMTSARSVSAMSSSTIEGGTATSSRGGFDDNIGSWGGANGGGNRRDASALSSIAQEWGITDPKVAAALLKRSKKIRQATQAKDSRELEKSSQHRYEKFLKHSKQPGGASSPPAKRSHPVAVNAQTHGKPAQRSQVPVRPLWFSEANADGK